MLFDQFLRLSTVDNDRAAVTNVDLNEVRFRDGSQKTIQWTPDPVFEQAVIFNC